jgi:hypothetical protein
MEQLVDRVAGLDVHRDTVVATVRRPRPGGGRAAKTLTFATTVAELTALGDWLVAEGSSWPGWSRPGCIGSRSTSCSRSGFRRSGC